METALPAAAVRISAFPSLHPQAFIRGAARQGQSQALRASPVLNALMTLHRHQILVDSEQSRDGPSPGLPGSAAALLGSAQRRSLIASNPQPPVPPWPPALLGSTPPCRRFSSFSRRRRQSSQGPRGAAGQRGRPDLCRLNYPRLVGQRSIAARTEPAAPRAESADSPAPRGFANSQR